MATTTPYALVFLLYLLGAGLLLLSLVGLYASQSEAAGVLGLVGFLAAFLGTALLVGMLWFELFITPSLATRAPGLAEAELGLAGFILVFLLGVVGWLLFGVATLRARAYPRWAAVLLMVGGGGFRPHTAGGHRLLRGHRVVRLRPLHGRERTGRAALVRELDFREYLSIVGDTIPAFCAASRSRLPSPKRQDACYGYDT
jgi:hypothetical protein